MADTDFRSTSGASVQPDKGSLGRKAKKAGMSTGAFSKKKASSGGQLGKQSGLQESLSKLRGKGAV